MWKPGRCVHTWWEWTQDLSGSRRRWRDLYVKYWSDHKTFAHTSTHMCRTGNCIDTFVRGFFLGLGCNEVGVWGECICDVLAPESEHGGTPHSSAVARDKVVNETRSKTTSIVWWGCMMSSAGQSRIQKSNARFRIFKMSSDFAFRDGRDYAVL